MAGQRNRSRRRRRAKAKVEAEGEPEVEVEPRKILDVRVLRRSLHAQIRGYFLAAVSRLPTTELNSTLARGLLTAGHCYGPLHPVHNIIVNSVWHSAAFPLRSGDRIDVAVINQSNISRVVQRSLDGLVAALRHHCPGLSDDDALWHLTVSGVDLCAAIDSVRGAAAGSFFRQTAGLEAEAAFLAAAKAARHPKPSAFALFASSVMPSVTQDTVLLLNTKHRLSTEDILRISTIVLPSPLPEELPHPPLRERFTTAFKLIDRRRNNLIRCYRKWVQMADAALRKYVQQTGERYLLHIVYGLGSLEDEFNNPISYHISFIGLPEDPSCGKEAPVFFFAEALCPNDPDISDEDITSCCVIQPSPSEVDSCHACITEDFQVDHPDDSDNFGGGENCNIDGFGEDLDCTIYYRCFDPDRDIDFVEHLDQDFIRYTSASAWHRRHKDNIDAAIKYYCIRYR